MLRLVAQVIHMNNCTEDVCVRYGGDEFIVIMPDTKDREALQIAQRLRYSLSSTPIPAGKDLLQITLSVDIAQWRCNYDAKELYASADQAMYQSKVSGRNRATIAPDCHRTEP